MGGNKGVRGRGSGGREENGAGMEKVALSKTPLTGVGGMGCLSLVPGS